MHTGVKPYRCEWCQKEFRDKSSLNKHVRIHTKEKPFVCVVCKKAFNQRVLLRNHIHSFHSGINKVTNTYECIVCKRKNILNNNLLDENFASAVELEKHIIQHCDIAKKTKTYSYS